MNVDDLCMGCMAERGGVAVCPECGWDERAAAQTANPLMLKPRSVLAGQYLIGRDLGHGGFGIVYLAWDLNLEMKLAIKEFMPDRHATRSTDRTSVVPFSGASKEFFEYGLTQFLEEGRKIARFNDHPGIVPVLNFFREHGTGYLVMSYVPGLTLEDHQHARGGRLPWQEALAVAMPVMDTLRAVHGGKLLHRDISPDNIYIAHSKQVKLLDFGAARQDFGNKSKSLILKTGFAPKEQYQTRGNQGPWTDVYALGATIYCLITGEIPPESLERNERDELVSPRDLGVDLPPAIEAALLKALAVEPHERFQTVAEMQAALDTRVRTAELDPPIRLGPTGSPLQDARAQSGTTNRDVPYVGRDRRKPREAVGTGTSLVERASTAVAAVSARLARIVTSLTGLTPLGAEQSDLKQIGIATTMLVGLLGVWWSLSGLRLTLAGSMGGIGAIAALLAIVALAGNLLLLAGSYLCVRGDARGPLVAWSAAWALAVHGLVAFAILAAIYASRTEGGLFPATIAPGLFTLMRTLVLMGLIVLLFSKRRAADPRAVA